MPHSVIKGFWFAAILSLASIVTPSPSFAHGGGGGGGNGGGGGGGHGGGAGVGAGLGHGGLGVAVGPAGSGSDAGGSEGSGATAAIGGVVGPAPSVGGIGASGPSAAPGTAAGTGIAGSGASASASVSAGAGSNGVGAAVAGIGFGTGEGSSVSFAQRGPSTLHDVLYGRPGSDEPTYGEVMQAGIRANSATEGAVSALPPLPVVAPVKQAPAPQYAAAGIANASDPAPPARHHWRRAHQAVRYRRVRAAAHPLPLQTSIVPASDE
jgi:hypothetical protein